MRSALHLGQPHIPTEGSATEATTPKAPLHRESSGTEPVSACLDDRYDPYDASRAAPTVSETYDLIMAPYPTIDEARADFDGQALHAHAAGQAVGNGSPADDRSATRADCSATSRPLGSRSRARPRGGRRLGASRSRAARASSAEDERLSGSAGFRIEQQVTE